MEGQAYQNQLTGNAYLTDLELTLSPTHPVNLVETTSLSVVAYDQFQPQSFMKQLYHNDALIHLLQAIMGYENIYHYACPMGAVNLVVMKQNDYFRWHFDQSEFVVSVPIQEAKSIRCGSQFDEQAQQGALLQSDALH